MHTGHDERTRAVLEHAKRKAVERETLPAYLKDLIEQLRAAHNDHEDRIAQLERVNRALVAEAAAKVKGAA